MKNKILWLVPLFIISGCSHSNVCAVYKIPSYLTDKITYSELHGNYSKNLPANMVDLRGECVNRGKDVVNLITEINKKNNEMESAKNIKDSIDKLD